MSLLGQQIDWKPLERDTKQNSYPEMLDYYYLNYDIYLSFNILKLLYKYF